MLSSFLAVLLGLTSLVPLLDAQEAIAASRTMFSDCPMERGGNGPDTPVKHHVICILCFVGGLAASAEKGTVSVPVPNFLIVSRSFATGVSATHGPKWTANPPTGPPSDRGQAA